MPKSSLSWTESYDKPLQYGTAVSAAKKGICMSIYEAERDGVLLTNDPDKIDLEAVCDLIGKQYWGPSRVRRTTKKAFENSYSFVLLRDGVLVGCARVVTDFATCAYIEDVVVDDSLRGMGIGQWMIGEIMNCPDCAEQHRWLLMTVDAQTFYEKLGFHAPGHPDWIMEKTKPYPTE